ncbi:AAA family ATPase [Undibacterium sp. CY18W]|uniref:AAA family ATPase n=1 Tax=Undibacterium hunanense TaxID=2762292 RepID=A0ABR6ZKL7_9BURK|nr:AAA family ATPase [Undibacterium hunanense]MBC3916432.1 AAA family ATPase [Undibacterium hunanense]
MLRLLGVPEWQPEQAPALRLPGTLPGCLLIYLACQARWLDRETVAELFWPNRARDEARHNLRINLHRVRQNLELAGHGHALISERTRLYLKLPLDLDALQTAIQAADGAQLLKLYPGTWLQGFRLPGFDNFWTWTQQHGEQLQRQWRAAAELALRNQHNQYSQHNQQKNQTAPDWPALLAQLLGAEQVLPTISHTASALSDDEDGTEAVHSSTGCQLFGRTSSLHSLRQLHQRAMVLTGEAGIGKSSLLRTAFSQAAILYGREGLTQIPYRPVVEYLQLHMPQLHKLLLPDAGPLHAYRLDLARLLPELAADTPLPSLDMLTAKGRLLEALARVFEASNPWLLVDDLQWCDDATLELLSLLTHRGALRWRAAARGNELSNSQRTWLERLRQTGHLRILPLEGLSLTATAQYCELHSPQHTWRDTDIARLHAASNGNPFILHEFMLHELTHGIEDQDNCLVENDSSQLQPQSKLQQRNRQLPGIFRRRREEQQLPQRVLQSLQQRLHRLTPEAKALIEAAAVLVQPLPVNVLMQIAGLDASDHLVAAQTSTTAIDADFLREDRQGLQCRHDLVRYAVESGLGMPYLQALHRRAALALGARPEGDADPLAVAAHWAAAQEPQTALAWMLRAAAQFHLRGRFDEARALWQQVAAESLDATQALHARLALANGELLTDLKRGRLALQEVLDQLAAVADPVQRAQIEGQALSGLVDNAVFSGDLATARKSAQALRPLLPQLRSDDRIHACEALIELAMREPDIATAWALLDQLRRQAPRRPSLSSFEAQIHWFSGDIRAARDAFEGMLINYPDYCRGLTIENDLAVMLHALGDLPRAEDMARRSLHSWAGVAHTETLSQLVLGSILTSAGRYDAALSALNSALDLARQQTSLMFEAEALVRRSRLYLLCGRYNHAQTDLSAIAGFFKDNHSPLPLSQYALMHLLCQISTGATPDPGLLSRLRKLASHSSHPILHARIARMDYALALHDGDVSAASLAAGQMTDISRQAGLQEMYAEALLLQARAYIDTDALNSHDANARQLLEEAARLADAQGYSELGWRAHGALATTSKEHHAALLQALEQLTDHTGPPLFLEAEAKLREPFFK